jgi:DNA invertase Pin-like site-specific DNA recombinase
MKRKNTRKFVAYYRVSTRKQEQSGLGLEAQRTAVAEYARRNGGTVIAEYTETETGKRSDRPNLAEAIGHARLSAATLVIAKLDRLARNVHFTSGLMESGIEFVACDNPDANKLTIHLLAAMAEHEATQISNRTKDALQAAKARGTKLGSARPGHWEGREHRRGWAKATKAAAEKRSRKAREEYAFLVPTLQQMHAEGKSFQKLAEWLNDQGHTTRRGAAFTSAIVWRILNRVEEDKAA